ncbi:MAG: peptidylprolyl isomerase [Planctomyces sp.]
MTKSNVTFILSVQSRHRRTLRWWLCVLCLPALLFITGCKGRSIKVENPVFGAAPPRKSLVNSSADAEESRIVENEKEKNIRKTGFSSETGSDTELTGTTIVAHVNGQAVFLDDVLGGYRLVLERHKEISASDRQKLLWKALRDKLPGHIDQEVVLQALNAKVPEDRREVIRESMEPQFQKLVEKIRADKGLSTDQELNELLAGDGMSIEQLREVFMRAQMVNGYVGTVASAPKNIDRQELVDYYQENIREFTPTEKVRYSEIVIRFSEHGGRQGAEKVLRNLQEELKKGRDFGQAAASFSDNLSAEKNGDMGWLERGALADKDLEELLFSTPQGETTDVQIRDERFELYHVINHTKERSIPFQDVQKEIEKTLLNKKAEEARAKVLKDLKSRVAISSILEQA